MIMRPREARANPSPPSSTSPAVSEGVCARGAENERPERLLGPPRTSTRPPRFEATRRSAGELDGLASIEEQE
jgi:hypothetical protein